MIFHKTIVLGCLFITTSSYAGDIYRGSYSGNNFNIVSLEFNIDFSNPENLKGTLDISHRFKNICTQQRSIDGSTYKNGELILIAYPSEAQISMNCSVNEFVGKQVGNKFVGKYMVGSQFTTDLTLEK